MTARIRRLASDWEQVKKDFTGHKNIIVTPVGDEPPEKYQVTYFVNGIYLLPNGKIETLGRHEIEIILHADYPRYKPICKISTPIWHPNFRDGQICIGDIWGAGESLSDIIINIGDMIQYKSWNAYSPLSADAAKWAVDNRHLFPVGNINLHIADYASSKDNVEIDLFYDKDVTIKESRVEEVANEDAIATSKIAEKNNDENDFNITEEELAGIEFIPISQRMQTISHGETVKGGKINFKTILVKGLLWALVGAFLGFGVSELTDFFTNNQSVAKMFGYSDLVSFYNFTEKANTIFEVAFDEFKVYCKANNKNPEEEGVFISWHSNSASIYAKNALDDYYEYSEKADDALYEAYKNHFRSDKDLLHSALLRIQRTHTALWAAVIALFIGLFLGIGEGIFYGSKKNAVKYAALGATVSIIIGLISGYLAQWMYSEMLSDNPADFTAAFVRGLGWAIMGLGVGIAVGLIKPEKKRVFFCATGGLGGGFLGGFLFNYVGDIIPNAVVARGVAIVIMGTLIGVGVGLLEQFAKQAWLKVIRGEFEGKEYLVFSGTTSIGNNGNNTIVLFKDKLVAPHHCDIKLEGSKYILIDCGTPMGTMVNGSRTTRHVLRQGDTIAIGNSVLIFNTK